MKDVSFIVILLLVAMIFGGVIVKLYWQSTLEFAWDNEKLLNECQKNLPRNEFCELKAVPKQNIEEK